MLSLPASASLNAAINVLKKEIGWFLNTEITVRHNLILSTVLKQLNIWCAVKREVTRTGSQVGIVKGLQPA